MTIESQLVTLIKTNESLRDKVEDILRELSANYSEIKGLLGAEFYVSKTIENSTEAGLRYASNSIQGIQAKIEKFRETRPLKHVTVVVESFTDAIPLRLTSARVSWQFLGSAEITHTKANADAPESIMLVSADRIRVEGLTVTYTNGSELTDQVATVTGSGVGNFEMRNGTFIKVSGDSLDSSYFSSGNFSRGA